MNPETHRRVTIGLGVAVVALATALVVQSRPKKAEAVPTTAATHDAGTPIALDPFGLTDGGAALVHDSLPEVVRDPVADGGIGSKMADGSPVPRLPEKAPRQVRFGVILVAYAGAQGAGPNARAKKDAEALAQKLSSDARTDFKGTIAKGDPGSSDDVGRVPRGVLELAPEYVLFTLPLNGVSDPVDTPRGFWIVKRTE